ncbi:MAG: alcohol dehydrogenase catalytic domain-containing protein [Rhodopirellula sp.]|nr:alcohol dehydrogenase catalytic domain-containing protein [Rhodopirellula sp.]
MNAAYYEGPKIMRVGACEYVPPGPGEVRLQVAYCGICGTDVHIFHGLMDRRVHAPQVIGHEASCEVAELGAGVEGVAVGDRVVVRPLQPGQPAPVDHGFTHIAENLKFIGIDTPGALQSFWTVPAHTLHRLPDAVSLEHGALVEPLAVACHDVRLSGLKPGEHVVVIGGGPIGLLIAMVARQKGGHVLVSEVNPQRLALAREFNLATVNPQEEDLLEAVGRFTDAAYADIVFEVSGTEAGVAAMTQLPRIRGRIVMVAIHSQPRPVDLFRFFWRELQLSGARTYEPEDFEEAIRLAAGGSLPLDRLITQISPLEEIQSVFESIDRSPTGMKHLVQCTRR